MIHICWRTFFHDVPSLPFFFFSVCSDFLLMLKSKFFSFSFLTPTTLYILCMLYLYLQNHMTFWIWTMHSNCDMSHLLLDDDVSYVSCFSSLPAFRSDERLAQKNLSTPNLLFPSLCFLWYIQWSSMARIFKLVLFKERYSCIPSIFLTSCFDTIFLVGSIYHCRWLFQ